MTTRLSEIVVDCCEPVALAHWWAETLGWGPGSTPDPGERMLRAPGRADVPALLFLAVDEPKHAKNRIHLDLVSESPAHHDATVDALVRRGATRVAVGQKGVPWTVLADPEGNEFCVLEPRDVYRDVGRLAGFTVDVSDPAAMARFWAEATGWSIGDAREGAVTLFPPGHRAPDLAFVRVDEPKSAKLRWHLDVEPVGAATVDAEAERLRGIGAVDVDIGQHADPATDWIVLADPEGNEFCVIPPL